MEFEALYKTYYKAIFHYCNKFFDSNNVVTHRQLAEDFTQEAFVEAYKQWNKFESEPHIKRFLYTVAGNRCRNELQTIRRHSISNKEILYLNSEGELPDYLAINTDVIAYIYDQLENLPPQCSKVMVLFFKEWSSDAIAVYLHITRKTVLNQKLKGIKKLKEQLILKFGYI